MSWMQKNYEKVLARRRRWSLLSVSDSSAGAPAAPSRRSSNRPRPRHETSGKTAVQGAEQVPGAVSSLGARREWQQTIDDERPLDLFTGPALFAPRDSKGVVDLWKGAPVHPPIANRWWLEHRVEPVFRGFAAARRGQRRLQQP